MRRKVSQITVKVVSTTRRKHFVFRWVDVDGQTRQEQSRWPNKPSLRGKAERDAKDLEDRLNADVESASDVTWHYFEQRYMQEHLPSLKPKSRKAWITAKTHLDAIIKPQFLTDVDASALSQLAAQLRRKTDRREKGVSESSIKSYLATIKAGLGWAVEMGLLTEAPKFRMPKKARGKTRRMRSRPVTGEEFDRIVAKLREGEDPEKWVDLAHGLFDGGLRISEAIDLSWDRVAEFAVDLSGRRPMFRITSEGQKNGEDQPLPIAPEFAARLTRVPVKQRRGRVFKLDVRVDSAVKRFSAAGEGIVVSADGKTATAHDLRRSFGTRWAKRVQPAVLKQLMRHKSIETTMAYYVDMNADELADELYNALPGGAIGGAIADGRENRVAKEGLSRDLSST